MPGMNPKQAEMAEVISRPFDQLAEEMARSLPNNREFLKMLDRCLAATDAEVLARKLAEVA